MTAGDALPSSGTPNGRRYADVLAAVGPYAGLVLVVALFCLLLALRGERVNRFLSIDNLKLMTVHASVTAAVALGMTLIMISGGIDLSVGYVVSLVTVIMMLVYRLAIDQPWIPFCSSSMGLQVPFLPFVAATASLWALLGGFATGGAFGAVNGLCITRLQVAPFVVTLGTMGAARGLAQYLSGGTPVQFPNPAEPPAWVPWLGAIEPEPSWLGLSPAVWSVAALGIVVVVVLRYTILGRYCYAIGSSEATARLCGIRVDRTKVVIYTMAGFLTGWGGILQFARSRTGLHDVQAGLELEVIAAVVIGGGSLTGGVGTVTGTLVGALLITVLGNGCSKLGLPMEFRYIIIGAIIVSVAALNSWRQRRLR